MDRFSVVYDACVMYPATLRDTLMRLALTDVFKAQWTDKIHEEWINALLRTKKYDREILERVRDLMDAHARDPKVTGYEPLIEGLDLPDLDDRHVLAAAIKCGANAIVTFNLKDFPIDYLKPLNIEPLHPDDFIYYQIDMAPAKCCEALRRQRLANKNPPYTVDEFLNNLQKQELPKTVSLLRGFADFL